MSLLAPLCQQLKQQYTPKQQSPDAPVRYWAEKDRLNDTITDAFVIILRTRGCSWAHASGCSMCGYFTDSYWQKLTADQLQTQFHTAMNHYHNEPIVKLFTSGSFFDPQEIPTPLQQEILSTLNITTQKVVVESRPQFITQTRLKPLQKHLTHTQLEVGMGLETANDLIRTHAINKGFTLKDYQKAAKQLNDFDIGVKTYLLIKPPFLTEQEAIDDTLKTVETIKDISSTISFNPCNVQRHTAVEYLWQRQHYRPPWLWSIIDILQQSNQKTSTRLQCDISGGGSPRGAHNCPTCNTICLDAIKQFSLTQQTSSFTHLNCNCKNLWKAQCENEAQTFGSIIDYQKGWQ